MNMSVRDVIIIGAGPSGLSAAIAAKRRDLDYLMLEQGVLVNSIYRFPPQMVFFTTPELLEIGGLPFVSPFDKPTRAEALKYYRKVVDVHDLQISYGEKVLSVEQESVAQDRRDRRGAGEDREAGGRRAGADMSAATAHESGDRVFVVETLSTTACAARVMRVTSSWRSATTIVR